MKNLQTIKHNAQKGFTLIELMIVVAIIGILAALAIPAYTDYTIKSRVGEGASLSGSYKTAMEIFWSENGTLQGAYNSSSPAGNSSLGLSSLSSQYVSDISISGTDTLPTITVQLRTLNSLGAATGKCFQYIPYLSTATTSNLTWSVAGATADTTALAPASPVLVDKSTAATLANTTVVDGTDCTTTNGIPTKFKPKR
ncbi:MAG: pilin [Cycloclasticus sp.]|jgi:type IV pilus assembly protein PilA|uniref:pilin n=1 Tax=Cycloclasticus sp. TaxID=2024830 RepID=UPI00257DBD1D|nr:pilin [Cycloclasticus sp.]MBV1898396.1 pilin [Cycloclasticus sp.]